MVRGYLARALAAAVVSAALPVAAQGGSSFVVPPGQDALMAKMFGAGEASVGPCSFAGAEAKGPRIRVTYSCGERGEAELSLYHRSIPSEVAERTEKFAIRAEGEVPEGLVAALAERVRDHEEQWEWVRYSEAEPANEGMMPVPPPGEAGRDVTAPPEVVELYERGQKLHAEGRYQEAVDAFVEAAREAPGYGAILGWVVSSIAPTKPTEERVKQLTAKADAAPDDPLAQFVAGVAAHYSGHYRAESREAKNERYRTAIEYLERTLPEYDFAPRVWIYLAVSHYRLGHQKKAEKYVEKAVDLDSRDPDAFYCRAEIYHRKKPEQAIADIERYMEMVDEIAEKEGQQVPEGKRQRVLHLKDYIQQLQRGEVEPKDPNELFDPVRHGSAALPREIREPRLFALAVLGVAFVAGAVGLVVRRRRRRRRRGAPD